jgi:opine dehydrogenase
MSICPTFAIIGGGNVGRAMAGHLSSLGYTVKLYNRDKNKTQNMVLKGGIYYHGVIEGVGIPVLISSDIEKTIENVDIIMITTPASAHKEISKLIASHLKEGQIIILNPGRSFGSLAFKNYLKKNGCAYDIIVGETQTVIYTTRTFEDSVEIFEIKNNVAIGTFPGQEIKKIMDIMGHVYPQLYPVTTTLEIALNNIGSILHPAPTILNTGWIESPETVFKYYYEGITPTIAAYLETNQCGKSL